MENNSEEVMYGVVSTFTPQGWGYLLSTYEGERGEQVNEKLWFHISSFTKPIKTVAVGTQVSFTVKPIREGKHPAAENILILK